MESWIKLRIARQCLIEIGWDDDAIESRIADWVDRAGFESVVNLPPEAIGHLANAMQNVFESEFSAMVGAVAA